MRPIHKLFVMQEPRQLHSFLYRNSFLFFGLIAVKSPCFIFKQSQHTALNSTLYDLYMSNFFSYSLNLSDECLNLRLPANRFKNITCFSFNAIDNFIAAYDNVSVLSSVVNSIGFIPKVKFPVQSLTLIGSNGKGTSFFSSSLGSSLLYDTK